jgi:hypothetical protein
VGFIEVIFERSLKEILDAGSCLRKAYHDWKGYSVNLPGESHECVMVFEGGSYTPPIYY